MKLISHHRIGSSLLVLLVVVAVIGNGCSEIAEEGIEHVAKKFRRTLDFEGTVRLSEDKKRITSAVGKGAKAYRGTPSQMASRFLNENLDLFGLTSGLADLRVVNEKARQFGANVEFQQLFNGLPVENGHIQINFDREGHVVHVVNSYTPHADALDRISVSKEQAVETVISEFLRTTAESPSKEEQHQETPSGKTVSREDLKLESSKVDDVVFARDGRLHRAYRISLIAVRPFGIKQFVTDANSGEILHTRNFVYNWVDGQAQVFKPNPVNSVNNEELFKFGGLTSVSTNNPNPYFTVPLRELEDSTEPCTLRGPFVVLEDIELPKNTPPCGSEANGFSFSFTREAPEFEDVMIYYHIDSMQRYIQKELLFKDVMNRPLRVDAHGLHGENNSRYVSTPEPGQGYLAFGGGGVEDAEDADVIAHEYGHAIQDNQAPSEYSVAGEPRAMGEGFSDYWAASFYARETLEHKHQVGCLMEWEVNPTRCHRHTDDGPPASSYHRDFKEWVNGRIWSRALFEIFTQLGKQTADSLIIQSHFNFSGSTFKAGADAIIAADVQRFAGSNKAKLCQIFVEREIYKTDDCASKD